MKKYYTIFILIFLSLFCLSAGDDITVTHSIEGYVENYKDFSYGFVFLFDTPHISTAKPRYFKKLRFSSTAVNYYKIDSIKPGTYYVVAGAMEKWEYAALNDSSSPEECFKHLSLKGAYFRNPLTISEDLYDLTICLAELQFYLNPSGEIHTEDFQLSTLLRAYRLLEKNPSVNFDRYVAGLNKSGYYDAVLYILDLYGSSDREMEGRHLLILASYLSYLLKQPQGIKGFKKVASASVEDFEVANQRAYAVLVPNVLRNWQNGIDGQPKGKVFFSPGDIAGLTDRQNSDLNKQFSRSNPAFRTARLVLGIFKVIALACAAVFFLLIIVLFYLKKTGRIKASKKIYAAFMLFQFFLALFLRFHGAGKLPVDFDERIYVPIAMRYADCISERRWSDIARLKLNIEHPAFAKLLYALPVLIFNSTGGNNRADVDRMSSFAGSMLAVRIFCSFLGAFQVLFIGLLSSWGGLFLAVSGFHITYTAEGMLEGSAHFFVLMGLFFFIKSLMVNLKKNPEGTVPLRLGGPGHSGFPLFERKAWLFLTLSAVGFGLAFASKYLTSVVPLFCGGILIFNFFAASTKKERFALGAALLFLTLTSLVVYVMGNVIIHHDPVTNFLACIQRMNYYGRSQQSAVPTPFFLHFLVILTSPIYTWFPGAFPVQIDPLILVLSLFGLFYLVKKNRFFAIYFALTALFLMVYWVKWPQYSLIFLPAMCLAAGQVIKRISEHIKKQKSYLEKKENSFYIYFIAPALIVVLVLIGVPLIKNIFMSFTYQGFFYLGVENFKALFENTRVHILDVLKWNITWTAISVSLQLTVGFMLALILVNLKKLRHVYLTILIIPWTIPQFVSVFFWRMLFNYRFGIINKALTLFGAEPVVWFNNVFWYKCATILITLWIGYPFVFIVLYGALQKIPEEYFEVLRLEGGHFFHSLWYILLPVLKQVFFIVIILQVLWTFNNYNIIALMQQGGSFEAGFSINIFSTLVYYAGFSSGVPTGFASSISVLILVILTIFCLIYIKLINFKNESL